jgi:hypothetical protein
MRSDEQRPGFERIADAVGDLDRAATGCGACALALLVIAFVLGAGVWSMFTQLVK